jgi:hypothetical protein
MKKQNISEYKIIQQEILSLKSCITNYVGYLIGGTGASLVGFAAAAKDIGNYLNIAFAAASLSIVVSVLLLITFYKFTAHNRFAGYSQLLVSENLTEDNQIKEGSNKENEDTLEVYSWYYCRSQICYSDLRPEHYLKMANKCNFNIKVLSPNKPLNTSLSTHLSSDEYKKNLISILTDISGKYPKIDINKKIEGWKILFSSLKGRVKTVSWSFPGFVIIPFFISVVIFTNISLYFALIFLLRELDTEKKC